jgi:hypothetical protein
MEKPLRFERMAGLGDEQVDELEGRVGELLERPWDRARVTALSGCCWSAI